MKVTNTAVGFVNTLWGLGNSLFKNNYKNNDVVSDDIHSYYHEYDISNSDDDSNHNKENCEDGLDNMIGDNYEYYGNSNTETCTTNHSGGPRLRTNTINSNINNSLTKKTNVNTTSNTATNNADFKSIPVPTGSPPKRYNRE